MAAKPILPAHPPFPTAWNLPFQFSTGSQSSISIWESEEGFSTAATRQRAGTAVCALPPERMGPAAADSAAVIVVFASVSDLRCSHELCAYPEPASQIARKTFFIR